MNVDFMGSRSNQSSIMTSGIKNQNDYLCFTYNPDVIGRSSAKESKNQNLSFLSNNIDDN